MCDIVSTFSKLPTPHPPGSLCSGLDDPHFLTSDFLIFFDKIKSWNRKVKICLKWKKAFLLEVKQTWIQQQLLPPHLPTMANGTTWRKEYHLDQNKLTSDPLTSHKAT